MAKSHPVTEPFGTLFEVDGGRKVEVFVTAAPTRSADGIVLVGRLEGDDEDDGDVLV